MVRVKICGITSIEDARACADAGADAIGVNLVPSSARRVTEETARRIAEAVGERVLVVAVVADLTANAMAHARDRLGCGCLQLHGDEPPEALRALLPHAYKVLRVADAEDVLRADRYGGEYLMVDAKVGAGLGGTGKTFDWRLVVGLAQRRKLVLAGGLTPENVAEAVRVVVPDCVDVASGVEVPGSPGQKDMAKVRAFIAHARALSA
jgi:phosphoribosylanthranilate isomerase